MKRRHNSKTLKAPSKYLGNAKEIYTPFTREGGQFLKARIFYQCNPFKWTDRANSVIVLLPQVSTNFCQYRSALKWLFLSMARNYNQQQNELGHFAHYSARPKHFGSCGPTVRLGYVTEVNWPRELVKRRKGTRQGASFSSYGNSLTVRKFGSLAVQSSLWTEWKYWTVSSEWSVRSKFSVGGKFIRSLVNAFVMLQKKHVSWRVKHWVTTQRSTMGKKIWLSMHLNNFGSDKIICTSTLSCSRM